RPVVALIGDGSAMYTCQALWTAAHDRVGVVFVILNNRSYRILKQRTNAMKGHAAQTDRYIGMDLTDPAIDFVAMARALGVAARRRRRSPAPRVCRRCAAAHRGRARPQLRAGLRILHGPQTSESTAAPRFITVLTIAMVCRRLSGAKGGCGVPGTRFGSAC